MENIENPDKSNDQAPQQKLKTAMIVPIIAIVIVLAASLWWFLGKGAKNTNSTNASTNAALSEKQATLDVTVFPAKIPKDEKITLHVKMKNTSSAAINYSDVQNSVYGFELWQKKKTTAEWTLEAQSYQYFRDLPEPRRLETQDFGTLAPEQTKEITFTLKEFDIFDAAPNSFWSVLGKDSSGTFYAGSKAASYSFTCGTDTFRIEFGKVNNLHANARGLMQADLFSSPALSNEFKMDTTELHTCT